MAIVNMFELVFGKGIVTIAELVGSHDDFAITLIASSIFGKHV